MNRLRDCCFNVYIAKIPPTSGVPFTYVLCIQSCPKFDFQAFFIGNFFLCSRKHRIVSFSRSEVKEKTNGQIKVLCTEKILPEHVGMVSQSPLLLQDVCLLPITAYPSSQTTSQKEPNTNLFPSHSILPCGTSGVFWHALAELEQSLDGIA